MTLFILISRFRSLFSGLLLLLALGGFSSSASAQQPWEDPGSVGEKIERSRGQLKEKASPSLPDQMQMMNRRAASLIQFLQSEVVAYFSQWSERMSQVLAGLIILFSFLRIWRENSGRGSNLFWWFARLGICLGLIGSGPWLINE